jgi:hypothetical protein
MSVQLYGQHVRNCRHTPIVLLCYLTINAILSGPKWVPRTHTLLTSVPGACSSTSLLQVPFPRSTPSARALRNHLVSKVRQESPRSHRLLLGLLHNQQLRCRGNCVVNAAPRQSGVPIMSVDHPNLLKGVVRSIGAGRCVQRHEVELEYITPVLTQQLHADVLTCTAKTAPAPAGRICVAYL